MASKPTFPSCLEPGLPTQTTLQRSALGISSSRITSTTWPRLSSKLPRSRKPSIEESRTRQGSLFGLRSRSTTRLARLFDTTRFERRALGTGKVGILSLPDLGVAVYCVLPEMVVKALDAAPHSSARYFFWTGKSTVRSAKGKWQRRLQRLFELAKVRTGHAHRLRDTFAVELLLAGVPLDRVSILLGHSSIRIAERHYAPWTRSRQEQIEADLKAAWSHDPVVLTDGKGAPELQTKTGQIN